MARVRVSLLAIGNDATRQAGGLVHSMRVRLHSIAGTLTALYLAGGIETMETLRELAEQWKQSAAYITEHGQLLCEACTDRNKAQLGRAGIGLELVPCHGSVLCTLCDREIGS